MTSLFFSRVSGSRAPLALLLAGPWLAGGLLVPAAPARAQAAPAPSLVLEEKTLGEVPAGSKLENALSTEDHLAWVEKKGNKQTVRLDGQTVGGVYDDVGVLRFSRDRQHFAFTAKRDSKWVLVLDGQERTTPCGRLTAPALAPNGKSFIVGACNGKSCRLVSDGGETGPEFEDLSAPAVSADGDHLAYFGKRDKKWTLQLDGKPYGPAVDDYFTWRFTPKADHVAVAALVDKHWTWVVDGKPGPGFDVISDLAVTPDWQHYAYAGADSKTGAAKNKTTGALVEDGRVTAQYEGSGFGTGVLGVFLGSYSYMLSGVRSFGASFHGLSTPDYSPDGKLVYAARRADGDIVVITGGTPGPSFEDVASPIVFSSDGKHVAYVARRGDAFVPVVDHKAGTEVAARGAERHVGFLAVGTEGDHLAYEIVRGGSEFKAGRTSRARRHVVVDGREGPEYDALDTRDFAFMAGGARYHYTVVGAEGSRDRVVFDGLDTRLFDNVFRASVEALDDQTIQLVAQDGQRLVKVTATLK